MNRKEQDLISVLKCRACGPPAAWDQPVGRSWMSACQRQGPAPPAHRSRCSKPPQILQIQGLLKVSSFAGGLGHEAGHVQGLLKAAGHWCLKSIKSGFTIAIVAGL